MPLEIPIRLKTGTDAERQAADIAANEPHATSDRRESWIGGDLINGHVYEEHSPNAVGNTSLFADADTTTTAANKANRRTFLALITPLAGAGAYNHKIVLPVTGRRAGDVCHVRVEVPANANPTIEIRDATAAGTQLTTAAIVGDAAKARNYAYTFIFRASGAWKRWTGGEELA